MPALHAEFDCASIRAAIDAGSEVLKDMTVHVWIQDGMRLVFQHCTLDSVLCFAISTHNHTLSRLSGTGNAGFFAVSFQATLQTMRMYTYIHMYSMQATERARDEYAEHRGCGVVSLVLYQNLHAHGQGTYVMIVSSPIKDKQQAPHGLARRVSSLGNHRRCMYIPSCTWRPRCDCSPGREI